MITAFILIVTKSGAEKEIVNALDDMSEIKDVRIVYGQYDMIAKVEVEDIATLNNFLLSKVRPINGVEDSSTLIAAY